MTITLKNFGPIKELTMDLTKNLHLLYGESSVGKSYAAYCVYLFLGELKKLLVLERYNSQPEPQVDAINEEFSLTLKSKRTEENNEIDTTSISIFLIQRRFVGIIGSKLHQTFQATFGYSLEQVDNQYTKNPFSITLATPEFSAKFALNESKSTFTLINFSLIGKLIARYDESNSSTSSSVGFEHENIIVRSQGNFIGPLLNYTIQLVANSLTRICSQVYFLPASRLGLYKMHTSFAPILAELSQHRFGVQTMLALPSLSTPDADYFQYLAQLQPHLGTSPLTDIAEKIEKEVLQGNVRFDERSKQITFQPLSTDIWKEVTNVSSMVAALAPLVLFLKYILTTSHSNEYRTLLENVSFIEKLYFLDSAIMLIFEEPEAHLHPTAQVKLMEILAELTKYNVRVMLTSHSDFMFSKLGNLVLGDTIDEKDIAVYHLVMTDEGSIDAGDMHITKQEIRETNFADVSEDLYDERLELIEKMRNKKKGALNGAS